MAAPPQPAEVPVCPACQGTGWSPLAVAPGEPRRVVRCACQVEARGPRLLEESGIPPRYHHRTLDSFELSATASPSMQAAYFTAKGYAANFLLDEERRGLVFLGPVGVGKTHLAVGIGYYLMQEFGVACRFCDYRDLLKRIQATFDPANPATESGVVAPYMTAPVLILDDLGVGRATEWALETLHFLINHRYSQQLPTLITTNLDDSDTATGPNSLLQAVGERLRSRLYEMCRLVPVHGPDFRRAHAR